MAPINEGRYTTSPVTPLAASEATSHLQEGDVDVQGPFVSSSTPAHLNDLIQSAVPVRPLRSSDAPLLSVARVARDTN